MRDPNRIPTVLTEIQKYWEQHPDLRLAQIVSNAAFRAGYGGDGFNMEDDVLVKNISLSSLNGIDSGSET